MDWASHVRRILQQLGEDVAYIHYGGGGPATVRGMFLNPSRAADLGVVGVTGTDPVFAGMASDLPLVAVNDTIQRGSVNYRVRVVRPDDPSGLTILELKKP